MTVTSYILRYRNTHLKGKIVILCIVILMLLTACTREGVQVSDEDKSINELLTTIYSNSQLKEMKNLDLTLEEMHAKYPIQCLRDKSNRYRASYRSESDVLIIYFDLEGEKTFSYKRPLSKPTSSEFLELEIGQHLNEVMEFDENGDYIFLYSGSTKIKISSHFTLDGYLIELTFDDDYKLKSIYYELI